ncbi:hypothetical protein FA15DRAFT_761035 [Coprinopsis marcescibilis]|uniref:DUF2415 domain-containing protein n=1 Tax=Coprinopsis marcescibilis TaxID=230819 RepID=A0A5C3KBY3_COPMA|nr:hypothetical protein FA15DRAFT_761035 [Coprinopsis marcescibilis]
MARDLSLLHSTLPTAIAPAEVLIGHVQLRDLVICPKDAGTVNYVQRRSIVEHNIRAPNAAPRTVAELDFTPNSLTSLPIGKDDVLIAAGGQDAEIHISYHTPSSGSSRKSSALRNVWSINSRLEGSINNSVLLSSLSLTSSNESSVEPRVGVSNNDRTVRLYDVPIRGQTLKRARRNEQLLKEAGTLTLDVPVNHSTISPDGRTLLSVGDSNKVYIHNITGGARVSFSHTTTLSLPPPENLPPAIPSGSLAASFSAAFSADGIKFAVASQEGVVAVWDVRSSKPLKVYHTEKSRGSAETGNASSWLSDDPWDWTRGRSRAPGWSVRNVKFGGLPGGREVLTFTEHTSLVHVIDAHTFESEEVIQIPITANRLSTSTTAPSIPTMSTPPWGARYLQPPSSVPHPLRRLRMSSRMPVFSFLSPSPSSRSPSPRPQATASPTLMITSPTVSTTRPVSTSSTPGIVQALSDTFRIQSSYSPPASIGDSTWRTLNGLGSRRASDSSQSTRSQEAEEARERDRERDREREQHRASEDEYDDIVVIPPLGDRDVESEVHALLEIHGITARQSSSDIHGDAEGEDGDGHEHDHRYEDDEDDDDEEEDRNTGSTHADYDYQLVRRAMRDGANRRRMIRSSSSMEVDELESDCVSSHAPSRAPSPSPTGPNWRSPGGRGSSQWSYARSEPAAPSRNSTTRMDVDDFAEGEDDVQVDEEDQDQDVSKDVELRYEDDLDLAGVCFDPAGEKMYVASTKSVTEWTIKGGEKRWFSAGQWR